MSTDSTRETWGLSFLLSSSARLASICRGVFLRTAAKSALWRYWAPTLVWTLAIVVLSGNLGSLANTSAIFTWIMSWIVILDLDTLSRYHFYCRQALHAICYGVLTILWFRALTASYPESLWTNRILALALLVSLTDEGRQYFVPGRPSSWWDVGLDMSGGVLFLFLYTCCRWMKNRVASKAQPPPS